MGELRDAFASSADEGERRLTRSIPGLAATGLVGGADVSLGIFALFLVEQQTGSLLLGSLAFTIGFIALTLANSELFDENFLVPITAVIAERAPWYTVLRLWTGTLIANLVGGWLIMVVIVTGYPQLSGPARHVAEHYVTIGIGWRSLAAAILGGAVITLMTWMERSTENVVGKLVAASVAAFLLAAAPLSHVIVLSLEMFAALIAGAPFGYLDWVAAAAWSTVGNLIGGLVLVTGLRVMQVGQEGVEEAREGGGAGDEEPAIDK